MPVNARFRRILGSISGALLLTAPFAASAEPMLVDASPAADAVVDRTATLRLNFSEAVSPAASKADLVMTSMPGMADMPLMRMPVKISAAGGKSLLLTAKAPLPAGTYKLSWTTAGADKSAASGSYAFTVR